MRQGKTVGIKGTSHKPIRHLIDKAIELAEQQGLSLHCCQKPPQWKTRNLGMHPSGRVLLGAARFIKRGAAAAPVIDTMLVATAHPGVASGDLGIHPLA